MRKSRATRSVLKLHTNPPDREVGRRQFVYCTCRTPLFEASGSIQCQGQASVLQPVGPLVSIIPPQLPPCWTPLGVSKTWFFGPPLPAFVIRVS
jgi:hypothetical protein